MIETKRIIIIYFPALSSTLSFVNQAYVTSSNDWKAIIVVINQNYTIKNTHRTYKTIIHVACLSKHGQVMYGS